MAVGVCFLMLVLLSAAASGHVPVGEQTGSYLRDPSHVQDKEHIREHMSEYYEKEDLEQELNLESEEATRFHYFKLHDTDNNNKLDGLELYHALAHYVTEHQEETEDGGEHPKITMDHETITKYVDHVLLADDFNEDGFIDYYEFTRAQEEAAKVRDTAGSN
jgi:Ca2+-binding EF-hand superfamily protein